jgi:hypothetical protein
LTYNPRTQKEKKMGFGFGQRFYQQFLNINEFALVKASSVARKAVTENYPLGF